MTATFILRLVKHYCMRVPSAPGMVSSHISDDPRVCAKSARFREPNGGDLEDTWYCADCWDYRIQWNRMQHERYGVPLIEP